MSDRGEGNRPVALVMGFGPFGEVVDNPSCALATALDGTLAGPFRIAGRTMPVSYRRCLETTAAAVAELAPTVVLGIGVAAWFVFMSDLPWRRPFLAVAAVVLLDVPIPLRRAEPELFEVDIDLADCDWFAVEQGLLIDVPKCTPLRVGFRHFDLTAPEPAEAYMAVSIGGEVVWEQTVEIPGGQEKGMANVYEVDFPAARDYAQGEQVVIHVHNHGENSYVFAGLHADLGDS